MRWVGIFMVISAVALGIVFFYTPKFDPGVNLPQIDAGKPFTQWDGIVVTCLPDGKLLLEGKHLYLANAVEEIQNALKAKEDRFRHLRNKLPPEYPRTKVSFVPVLLCMDKGSTIDVFFSTLDILCQAYCGNLHIALTNAGGFSTLSLCTWHCVGVNGFYIWHEEFYKPEEKMRSCRNGQPWTGNVMQIWVEAGRNGKYRFNQIQGPHVTWKWIGTEPKKYSEGTIEPLFDMIEKNCDKKLIIVLDLFKYDKKLTWQWLTELISRLEKAPIKAYLFSSND